MGISLGSNFDVQTSLPLDSRTVVTDITARDAISPLRRYEGMSVYVIATQKEYTLKGGITNTEWTEAMAQGVTVVNTATDRDAITLISRYEGMLVYVKDSKVTYQMTSGALTNDGWTYYYGVTASDDVGEIITSARELSDPHEGTLPCDGATLYDATLYTTLAAKFWNSTQSKWKFGGTGTYPTGQFRTPNLKGAFVRGADLGAGRDLDAATRTASGVNGVTGDAVGSYQDEAFKSHTHIQDAHNHTQNPHTHSMNQLADTVGTTGAIGTRVNVSFDQYTNAATATNNPTTATNQNAGGSETRPKNIAVNFFVRYKPSTRGPKGDTGNAINVVADDTARLAIPAGDRFDGYLAYVQSTKKNWQLQGGINNTDWKEIGTGGSGSGNINFVSNPDGNQGVTGWTEGSYTAAIRPSGSFTASSGAGTFAISTTTTTPLGTGTTSFLLTKSSGASRQGRAVETSFALPLSYRAKVLKIEADYIVNSGTFVAGSNSTDSSLIWYCAFSTDGGTTYTVAEPGSFKLLSNSTTISDKFSASIQTPSDATNMKLIAYVSETANSAWVVKCVVAVSPSNYVYGTPITDWTNFTASGSWTANTTYSGKIKKNGDSVDLQYTLTLSGAPNATNLTLNLPPGLSIDTSKLTSSFIFAGGGNGADVGVQPYGQFFLEVLNSTSFIVRYQSSVTAVAAPVSNTTPFTWGNTDSINLRAENLPILGWSSSVQVSDGYDGRVIATSAFGSGSIASGTTPNTLNLGTVIIDKTNSLASNTFTVPSAGDYSFTGHFQGNSASGQQFLSIFVDGVEQNSYSSQISMLANGQRQTISGILPLKSGQLVTLRGWQNSGSAVSMNSTFNIQKLSGNPVISATETVAARYTTASGQTINNGASVVINFDTKVYDTHGAVTVGASWVFKAPIEGLYTVDVGTGSPAATNVFAANNVWQHILRKNQTGQYSYPGAFSVQASGSQSLTVNGSDTVYLLAGETIDLTVFNNTGVNRTLLTNAAANYISIKKVK